MDSTTIIASRYRMLAVADTAIALFVTFPITCMYWRGIWDLIGWYVLRDNTPLNYWVHAFIGLFQMVGLAILPLIDKHLDANKTFKFWIITRIFMYVHTLTYMFYWRGVWELLNHYFSLTWQWNLGTLALGWATLTVLGGCRSSMWPPFFIAIDTPTVFKCNNRFETKPEQGGLRMMDYLADAFISQIVVLGTAILCWRSAFNIMDDVIYPSSKVKSDAVTALVGLSGCAFFLSLQVPLGAISKRLHYSPLRKLFYEDFVYLGVFAFLSLMWRGVWNLNAEYLIKELPLGGWVHHAAGTVLLMAMATFTEVSAFGMLRDGTDEGGEAFFPLDYLRHFFKSWYSPRETGNIQDNEQREGPAYTNDAYITDITSTAENMGRQVSTTRQGHLAQMKKHIQF